MGLLLFVKVHPGNIHDSVGAKDIFEPRNNIDLPLLRIWVDRRYQGEFQKFLKKQYQIVVEIVKSIKYKGRVPKRY